LLGSGAHQPFASKDRKSIVDPVSGRPMKANLPEYLIPVDADVPSLEAILVEVEDRHVNELGVKGVREIGITGSAGAVANAIWHATGARVRKFPITLDQLI
jgi:xanthine dehydrogenase YagR molybdenum-binding subunit